MKFYSVFNRFEILYVLIAAVNIQSTHLPSSNIGSAKIIQPQVKQQIVNVKPQKPTTTISAVQPQSNTTQSSITQSISNATSAILQRTSSITSKSQHSTEQSKGALPQIPPRQGSVSGSTSGIVATTRGPPPAIPPRNNVPAPMRSSSIQVTTAAPINRPAFTRQTSTNSIPPPQCTRQPAPKFVIPQRQNSRTSMNRSGSISGPSSNEHHD